MQPRLIRAIEEHQPLEIMQELKLDGNAPAALFLAAKYGRLDVVSWLLNEDVVFPFSDHKISWQQEFSAKFLGACGAFNMPQDPVVTEGVCFRALRQSENIIAGRVIPYVSNRREFAALACERNNIKAATELYNTESVAVSDTLSSEFKYPAPIQSDFNYTCAYWVRINNLEVKDFQPIPLKEAVLTLKQLSTEEKFEDLDILYKWWEKNKEVDRQFFGNSIALAEEKLAAPLQKFYHLAATAKIEKLKAENISIEDCRTLVTHAYARKNYVSIKSILDCCDNLKLLTLLMSENHDDCSLFLIIGGSFNLFDLALAWKDTPQLLEKFIKMGWGSMDDFVNFSKPIAHFKTTDEWKNQKKYEHLNKQIKKLTHFTDKLDEEIEAKPCCDRSFKCNRYRKVSYGISFSVLLASITFLSYALSVGIFNDNLIFGFFIACLGTSGASVLAITSSLLCDQSCPNDPRNMYPDESPLIVTGVEARFHTLELNQYNNEIKAAMLTIAREYEEAKENPFANRNLDSKVSDVLPDIKRLITEKQALLDSLKATPEHKIDINEDTEDESDDIITAEKLADDNVPDLLIRTHGLFASLNHTHPTLENKKPLLFEPKRGLA